MRERPILFSAPMVRAILAGTKTQTRRAWREQPPPGVRVVADVGGVTACPHGGPGDWLWVRETWGHFEREPKSGDRIYYRADGECVDLEPWRPSIHMPRWASRITLEITDVRVERLQDISEADAMAEGIERGASDGFWRLYGSGTNGDMDRSPRVAYRALWESINGPGSWDANPWVWVVAFKRADREPAQQAKGGSDGE